MNNPYTEIENYFRQEASKIDPRIDVRKITVRYGPSPWDCSTNFAMEVCAQLKKLSGGDGLQT